MKILDLEGLTEVVNNIKNLIRLSADSILTNSKKYTDDNVELIKNQILDPDNHGKSSVKEGGVVTTAFKRGYIDSSTGEESEGEDYLITSFIPVENDKFTLYSDAPVDSTIRIYVYDNEQNWIGTANDNLGYYKINNGEKADITSKAKYIRCRISSSADSGTLTATFDDTIIVDYDKHQKIYFNNGYNMESTLIEDNLYQLQVNSEENEFNIFTIAAPKDNASEATLSLMVNDEEKTQFVDLSCMKYSEDEDGYFCTILQSRGDTPLPRYILGFNDGKGAGRVRKLEIEPDAVPMQFISDGIRVRKDNAYDNNWTDDNSVVVNLAELAEKVYGTHAWQMQTLNSSGEPHGASDWLMQVKHDVDGDGYFKIICGDGSVQTKVDKANTSTNANNADTLDGYHAASFALTGFGGSDMNTMTTSGMYRLASGNANAPSGADWGQLIVCRGGGDTIAQLIFDYNKGRCWLRTGNPPDCGGSGSWTSWRQLYTSENITYGTDALTAGSSSLASGSIYYQYE